MRGRLRRWDRCAAERPDLYLANSSAVAERIARFYGRASVVVPPPVALRDFPRDVERDPTRFLWVHRLVSYKRPLGVAAAFRELPELRLTIVGVGPLEPTLKPRIVDRRLGRLVERQPAANVRLELVKTAGLWKLRWRAALRELGGAG